MYGILIVFLTGFIIKFADMIADDGLKAGNALTYFFGSFYGFLLAFIISANPMWAELGIAVILGVLLTGKIDHPVHYSGLGSFMFFTAVFGLNPVNLIVLLVFIGGASVDEIGNNLVDRKRIKGILGKFFECRLTMDVVAFAVSLLTGYWAIFFGMLAFDAGYTYVYRDVVKRKIISMGRQ